MYPNAADHTGVREREFIPVQFVCCELAFTQKAAFFSLAVTEAIAITHCAIRKEQVG